MEQKQFRNLIHPLVAKVHVKNYKTQFNRNYFDTLVTKTWKHFKVKKFCIQEYLSPNEMNF